ncbi:MAG: HAD hydrolase-like protein [Chlorobiales bacterium]|jgi:FMN phosphatase YigB (HAD superfamily)|nr:HAD hydrolase-like protein [Chlorobiales bacterium]
MAKTFRKVTILHELFSGSDMSTYRAILFNLDSLTKAKVETDQLKIVLPELGQETFPILGKHLTNSQIKLLIQNAVLVYNACMELSIYQGFQAPTVLNVCEQAISKALLRTPSPDEIEEVVKAIAAPFHLNFSKKTLLYLNSLYHSGYILGIVANLPIPLVSITERLKVLGILRLFESIIISSDCGFHKPGKKIFKIAIESLECKEQDVVIVGTNLDRDIFPLDGIDSKKIYFNNHRKLSGLPNGVGSIHSLEELKNIA